MAFFVFLSSARNRYVLLKSLKKVNSPKRECETLKRPGHVLPTLLSFVSFVCLGFSGHRDIEDFLSFDNQQAHPNNF